MPLKRSATNIACILGRVLSCSVEGVSLGLFEIQTLENTRIFMGRLTPFYKIIK